MQWDTLTGLTHVCLPIALRCVAHTPVFLSALRILGTGRCSEALCRALPGTPALLRLSGAPALLHFP